MMFMWELLYFLHMFMGCVCLNMFAYLESEKNWMK